MHTARRPAGDRGLCPGYHPSPIDHRRSGPPRSVPLTQHRAGTNPHQAYPTFFLWVGCNEPNHRISGGGGTGGYQGTGSWQEGRYLGRFIAGRGGCGHVRSRTAVNFCCPASCGSTHPNQFRNKNGAPSFLVGQARGSSSKLSVFDFTSTAVYCHACLLWPTPQCPNLWHMSSFLAKKYFFPPA